MSLLTILRSGIKIADQQTESLQATVKHEAYLGQGGMGERTYASPVMRKAIVDWKQHQVRTIDGELTVSRAIILFPRPIVIDDHDRFTLPDGTTGPILDMGGFIDAGTGVAMYTEVYLG